MLPSRRNLIIAAVGDGSQHGSWLTRKGARSFDAALIYYGQQRDAFRGEADYYFQRQGVKYSLVADVLDDLGDRLVEYSYIWIPDDDVAATLGDVNRLFEIVEAHDLLIAQPAIATGETSYRSLQQQPNLLLRYTRFVEVMCPVFSQDALQAVRPTFRATLSAWGIDWAWTQLVDRRRMAVVDAVGVDHTRRLGTGEAYDFFAQHGVSPSDECRRMLREHGLNNLATRLRRRQLKYGTARCEAIDLAGRRIIAGPPWWKQWSAPSYSRDAESAKRSA